MKSDRQQKSFLTKKQYEALSPQDQQFAEEQFRLIYAQQMSKLSMDLSHKRRVLENIHLVDQKQAQNLKDQYEKLKSKMTNNQNKRNKNLQQKVNQYKQQDQRWMYKIKQIQNKFRQQNRQAIQKAKKYRQQSQKYWKSKEKKSVGSSRTHFAGSRRKDENEQGNMGNSFVKNNGYNIYNNPYNPYKTKKQNKQFYNKTHRDQPHREQEDIDEQIKMHRQRSWNIQKQRQNAIFQKAVQKLQKINKKKQIINKKQESKIIEPTVPRKIDHNHNYEKQKNKAKKLSLHNQQQKTLRHSKSSIAKLVKEHQEVKKRIEQSQFSMRNEKAEENASKNRKQKIVKMIKSKVNEMKKQIIKNQ